LGNLPPELLDIIVNLIEDEDGWYEYPTDTLLNMREICRVLERACHNRFVLYFHEWVIDTEKDPDMSITKAVLASHVHAAAIEKITFTYKRCGLSLWQLTPLLHEICTSLASLNRKFVLVLDPFADFEAQGEIRAGEVMDYFNMILVMVAVNKLAISSIHVRARREDWDKQHASFRKSQTSIRVPHQTFAHIEHEMISKDIHKLLKILKVRNLHTFHWHEFHNWSGELKCNKVDIKNCNLAPSELGLLLLNWRLEKKHALQSLLIADTVLYKKTAREDGPLSRKTSVGRLLDAIIPYARHLKHIRLANIWGGNGNSLDSTPAFKKALGELHMKGRDGMHMLLVRLRYEQFDEGAISRDEDTPVQDEDATSEDEDATSEDEDTTGQDEELPVREDTTSQVEDMSSRDEGTTSRNEDTTSQDEDTISPEGLLEFLTF
jgi:hypothetical protein